MEYEIKEVNYDNLDFRNLCEKLEKFQSELIPERADFDFSVLKRLEKLQKVLLFYDEGRAIASAALKPLDEITAEISRIYTEEDYRGKGLAKQLIIEIIEYAKLSGYKKLILYTWKGSDSAINLYKKIGFVEISIDNIEDMSDDLANSSSLEDENKLKRIDELTVYMEKEIDSEKI